ncbi:putative oligopeptide transport system ATP-binding protein, partial [Corynebacterium diphtheriae DSM 43988]
MSNHVKQSRERLTGRSSDAPLIELKDVNVITRLVPAKLFRPDTVHAN